MRFRVLALVLLVAPLWAAGGRAQPSRSVVTMTLTQSDHGGGRVYLPVRFGNVMGAMRLDTGAATTRIALASWNRDLPIVGASASTGASGTTTRCDDVEATNVALKAAQGNDVARAKYVVTRCAESDGDDLLGLDFFKNARFTLDFERRETIFFDAPLAGGPKRPFRRLGPEKRLVGVPLRIGDVAAVGLFDTGAEICAVDLAFAQKHRNLFTPATGEARASDAGGKKFASRIYRIRKIDLGDGRVARDVYALAHDFGPLREALGRETTLILGYNLLSRFKWELDFGASDKPAWTASAGR